jgi:hypothetical protein
VVEAQLGRIAPRERGRVFGIWLFEKLSVVITREGG